MTLPRYPKLQDSGIDWLGRVPAHWRIQRLRHLVQLNPSKIEVAGREPAEEISFLPMEAIGERGQIDLSRTRPLRDVINGYTYFRNGDVALAKITPCFENGKGCITQSLVGGVGFGTTELTILRAREGVASESYVYWLTRSSVFRRLGEAAMYGAGGQKRVPDDFVRDFALAFPPLHEQWTIAAFLDRETGKIDALVAEQEKLIDLLKEKRQAVISHAVTKGLDRYVPMKHSGVEWLGDVPEHWEVCPLKHLIARGTSITYGIVQAGPHVEDGVPYIKTSDMSGDALPLEGYSKTSPEIDAAYTRSKVASGDIVVAIRATVGKCLRVPPELDGANLTQGTAKVSPGLQVVPEFLLYALGAGVTQAYFDLMAKGATFREITLDSLRRTPVAVPPLDEQARIAASLSDELQRIAALADESARAVDLLRERRSALISAAVTGKIDVRGLAAPEDSQQEAASA